MDGLWHKLTFLVPNRLRFWIVVRACADASTGQWSDQEVPELRAMDVLKRMS
jgi:hypothetical protein